MGTAKALRRLVSIALLSSLVSVGLMACVGGAPPASWVAADSEGALFYSWTERGGSLTGQGMFAEPGPNGAAVVSQFDLTGELSDGRVTLRLDQDGNTQTLTGTITSDTLTLSFADASGTVTSVLHPGTADEFQDATEGLPTNVQE